MYAGKDVRFGVDARAALMLRGVELAEAVKLMMDPKVCTIFVCGHLLSPWPEIMVAVEI